MDSFPFFCCFAASNTTRWMTLGPYYKETVFRTSSPEPWHTQTHLITTHCLNVSSNTICIWSACSHALNPPPTHTHAKQVVDS